MASPFAAPGIPCGRPPVRLAPPPADGLNFARPFPGGGGGGGSASRSGAPSPSWGNPGGNVRPPIHAPLAVGALPFASGDGDGDAAARRSMPPPPPRLPDRVLSSSSSTSGWGPRPPPPQHRRIRWDPPSRHERPLAPHGPRGPRPAAARGGPSSSSTLSFSVYGEDGDAPSSTSASAASGSGSQLSARSVGGGRASTSTSASASSSRRSSVPTSAVTHRSTGHGRRRRRQRGIAVRDLQAARKHGRRRPGGRPGTSVYEYGGVAYVVEDATGREVTSYALEEQLFYHDVDDEGGRRHAEAAGRIRTDRSSWRSHSVVLVDTSGSMRESDVRGARTRLGAVWVSLARDFVAQRLRSGEATDMDVVTIVRMGSRAEVLVSRAPTDWTLYNRILRIHHGEEVRPGGHGYYAPAIELAERLLLASSDASSCALMLWILSDGRPSDARLRRTSFERSAASLTEQVRGLASRLGRRLTVATIGMGSDVKGEFAALRDMAAAATEYASQGTFQLPSMTTSGLGAAVSSVATSLTASQTELEGGNNDAAAAARGRKVRAVTRENRKRVPLLTEVVDKEHFDIFMKDKVEHMVYDPNVEGKFRRVPLQNADACGVAMRKVPFDEGQERFAYQFFEVAEDGETVVSEPLVAKESRFVEDHEHESAPTDGFGRAERNWEDRDRFVKRFCRIQHLAEEVSEAFNEKLDGIKKLDPDTARVTFLGCSVYYLTDDVRGQFAVLVERRLFGKWKKWNSNNGWHIGQKRRRVSLEPVAEEREEEDEREVICLSDGGTEDVFVTHSEVAQAFSHFSYVYSGSKHLICDLQGEYSRQAKKLYFTDPVIHYHDLHKHSSNSKRQVYGRTDHGRKGIQKFFDSHECNGLCDLITRGFREPHPSKRQKTS